MDVLPEIFSKRRGNRGLENVAVSPDGKTAVTFMQSPMGEPRPLLSHQPNDMHVPSAGCTFWQSMRLPLAAPCMPAGQLAAPPAVHRQRPLITC